MWSIKLIDRRTDFHNKAHLSCFKSSIDLCEARPAVCPTRNPATEKTRLTYLFYYYYFLIFHMSFFGWIYVILQFRLSHYKTPAGQSCYEGVGWCLPLKRARFPSKAVWPSFIDSTCFAKKFRTETVDECKMKCSVLRWVSAQRALLRSVSRSLNIAPIGYTHQIR